MSARDAGEITEMEIDVPDDVPRKLSGGVYDFSLSEEDVIQCRTKEAWYYSGTDNDENDFLRLIVADIIHDAKKTYKDYSKYDSHLKKDYPPILTKKEHGTPLAVTELEKKISEQANDKLSDETSCYNCFLRGALRITVDISGESGNNQQAVLDELIKILVLDVRTMQYPITIATKYDASPENPNIFDNLCKAVEERGGVSLASLLDCVPIDEFATRYIIYINDNPYLQWTLREDNGKIIPHIEILFGQSLFHRGLNEFLKTFVSWFLSTTNGVWSKVNITNTIKKYYCERETTAPYEGFDNIVQLVGGQQRFTIVVLQLFKTLGDLSQCVEFADPRVILNRDEQAYFSKVFISHDWIANTFARKLAKGTLQKNPKWEYLVINPRTADVSKSKGKVKNVLEPLYYGPGVKDDAMRDAAGVPGDAKSGFGSKREYFRFLGKYSPMMLLPSGFIGVSAGKKYLKKRKKQGSFGRPRKKVRKKSSYGAKLSLKDAKVRVAKRKWLGPYSGKTYPLTTLANHFGVSLRQGRGWKRPQAVVKVLEKRMKKYL